MNRNDHLILTFCIYFLGGKTCKLTGNVLIQTKIWLEKWVNWNKREPVKSAWNWSLPPIFCRTSMFPRRRDPSLSKCLFHCSQTKVSDLFPLNVQCHFSRGSRYIRLSENMMDNNCSHLLFERIYYSYTWMRLVKTLIRIYNNF